MEKWHSTLGRAVLTMTESKISALDKRVAQEPESVAGKSDAAVRLYDDANGKPIDTAKDKPRETSFDLGQAREVFYTRAEQSFDHAQNSLFYAKQITDYVSAQRPMSDRVVVPDASGVNRTMTVGEHIQELKGKISREASDAVALTREIDPKLVMQMMSDTIAKRNMQARELGLNVQGLDEKTVSEEIGKTSDNVRKAKLQQLLEANQQVDKIKAVENAPAAALLNYANLKGGGYTNPAVPVERMPNGRLKSDQRDVLEAMGMIIEAGKNKDLRNHEHYVRAINQVLPRLETGTERAGTILDNLQKSVLAGAKGDKVEQEKLLRDSVNKADNMNIYGLAQLIKDPKFAKLQNPKVLEQMEGTIAAASMSRLKLAELLTEQGKFGEAQKLTLRVKAEVPEAMYNTDPDGNVRYNLSPLVDLKKLDQNVTRSSNFNPDQLSSDLAQYQRKIQQFNGQAVGDDKQSLKQKEVDNTKLATEIQKLEDSMKGQLATQSKNLEDAKKGLVEERQRLNVTLLGLEKEFSLTDEMKEIKKISLERELQILSDQELLLDREAKANNRNQNVVRMLEATFDLSKQDTSAARANLQAIKQSDPELWQAKAKAFEAMSKAAEEPGWWDRWGRKAALVAAAVAGAAVAIVGAPVAIAAAGTMLAATSLSGTSLAVGTAILGTGLATVGGAAAGGFLMGQSRLLADVTDGRRTSKETWKEDLFAGASAGADGALMASSIGLGPRLRSIMGAATTTEGAVLSSRIASPIAVSTAIASTTAYQIGLDKLKGEEISPHSVAINALGQGASIFLPFKLEKQYALFAEKASLLPQIKWSANPTLIGLGLTQGSDLYNLFATPSKLDPGANVDQAGLVSERAKHFMPVTSSGELLGMVQQRGKTVVTNSNSILSDALGLARVRDYQRRP